MKRIYLLGPNGMLGQMVNRYFSARSGWEVVALSVRFDMGNLMNYFRRFDHEAPGVFVNGIGGIPQKLRAPQDFVLPNVLLPLELARSLSSHHLLVHPSTDCVFRGDMGHAYASTHVPDATDPYGWTKLQAERILLTRPRTWVVRTSIIGPSVGQTCGLLAWFLAQPRHAALTGFTNQLWNGLTTLQWCKELETLLSQAPNEQARLIQMGTAESYSKFDMLQLFRDRFRTDVSVAARPHADAVDRRLQPDHLVKPLQEQLDELAAELPRS